MAQEINPASKKMSFLTNKKIKLLAKNSELQTFQITEGKNWVFQYQYIAADVAEIADDEFTESIFIEIPQSNDKHFYKKLGLKKQKAIYLKSCYCPDAGPLQIEKGSIKAKKLNENTWFVKIQFVIPTKSDGQNNSITKKIEGNFTFIKP